MSKEFLATGQFKIRFIDVPFTCISPLFAKYDLYAAHVNADTENVLRACVILFEAVQGKCIKSEDALIEYLQKNQIAWKGFDEKPIFKALDRRIHENRIEATPTCVIYNSAAEVKKYVRMAEIWIAPTKLKIRVKQNSLPIRKGFFGGNQDPSLL